MSHGVSGDETFSETFEKFPLGLSARDHGYSAAHRRSYMTFSFHHPLPITVQEKLRTIHPHRTSFEQDDLPYCMTPKYMNSTNRTIRGTPAGAAQPRRLDDLYHISIEGKGVLEFLDGTPPPVERRVTSPSTLPTTVPASPDVPTVASQPSPAPPAPVSPEQAQEPMRITVDFRGQGDGGEGPFRRAVQSASSATTSVRTDDVSAEQKRAAAMGRMHNFLLRSHLTALFSALCEDGWITDAERDRLHSDARQIDRDRSLLFTYIRYMETNDIQELVQALKRHVGP
ncbi:unnamed protein product [Vitrella brassicaformis CCMP3155]|uniref:Uncharacterized protein n=1 Tax=Vitrella brassicaformis (strain CCMP3155) TaxID=1169540 RepID=A0A0G4FAK1_VITBC|nr:unnamed protein product [Vitrella brassicaformis CCMP3155]|mmetsp:Transcript_40400/g.101077  ORF Transcript_40400/g.101077 Transcript_40400/m.101077 type:complete len:285 (-) Transcript_40400:1971-2825(-)|eukprot:CEM09921.1 unnamed protein product [Vitrella brassicaformis CCMP3155]